VNGKLKARQIAAVARLELLRYAVGRRWLGVYLLALAPLAIFLLRAWYLPNRLPPPGALDGLYGMYFQLFVLRFAIFVSCGVMFSQLFRGETLEKTLHFYLLTPASRGSLAVGKYLAALAASVFLFGVSTVFTYLLFYLPVRGAAFWEHPGVGPLVGYLGASTMACAAYGAVFLLIGLAFKNPAIPGLALMAWEAFSFLLPATLQAFSVSYYLQPLLPVRIDRGPFAVMTETVSPAVGIPGLILFALGLIAVSGSLAKRLEVNYGAE
jgi:ABC-type transport system involved in multi-copper enzyme maturation permease subunit